MSAELTVSGAGSSEVNGDYVQDGTAGGKPKYVFADAEEGLSASVILWESNQWFILYEDLDYYNSSEDVDFPWQVETWNVGDFGSSPVPTVTGPEEPDVVFPVEESPVVIPTEKLPAPLVTGYSGQDRQENRQTVMESSRTRVRNLYAGSHELLTLHWAFTRAEFDLWRDFYHTELKNGELFFITEVRYGDNADSLQRVIRIVEPWQYSYSEGMFNVTATVEMREGGEPEESEP